MGDSLEYLPRGVRLSRQGIAPSRRKEKKMEGPRTIELGRDFEGQGCSFCEKEKGADEGADGKREKKERKWMAEYLFLLRLYANQLKRPHPSELATSFLRQRRRVYSGKTTLYSYSFYSFGVVLYILFRASLFSAPLGVFTCDLLFRIKSFDLLFLQQQASL